MDTGCYPHNFFSAVTVGFTRTLYSVRETDRAGVQVCVNVKQPRGSCPIQKAVNFTFYTIHGSAGTNTL